MAARVSQMVGQKDNPGNFLLMHAMGPNVAGVIGSAIAAGVLHRPCSAEAERRDSMEFLSNKTLLITDTILRDAHQSQAATRMRTEEMLPACEMLDNVGYYSLECWGGATFDACLRFLNEDPWERLRKLRKALPNTKLQMLLPRPEHSGLQALCRRRGGRLRAESPLKTASTSSASSTR